MTSTGHLPKFADEAYHLERDDLWAIPTAEVPLTSMHRGEILEESVLPLRFTAATACYRREAGSAGRDTRGLLRVHEFDKVELFAYTTPDQALEAQADILQRAESMLQELALRYRVMDLCTGDLGGPSTSRRTRRVSTSGWRSARPVGTATTRPGGPRCATARPAADRRSWSTR
jgi:seryl-tRNA synthetase